MLTQTSIQRAWILYAGVVIVALLLVSQLFLVQIVNGEKYTKEAQEQYVGVRSTIFDRGTIYFSQKNEALISAATLKSGFSLIINPSKIENAEEVYKKLSELVEIDKKVFLSRAEKVNDPHEEILRQLDKETAQAIQNLNLEGVMLVREQWRFYPAGSLASQTLGFVGYKGNTLSGRYGLERTYNDILQRGENKLPVNFFAELFSNLSKIIQTNTKNTREGDIITTLEFSTQDTLEKELEEIKNKWNADGVGGLIINPQTGAIYALGNLPNFNPNSFNTVSDQSVFSNPLVENVYEMGSIVKSLTMAIGLDDGVVSSDSTYYDKGYLWLDGKKIQNYDGRGRGTTTMQNVLNKSLNTGAVHVMREVGKETFRDYMYDLGINQKTNIDLPNETKGLTSNLINGKEVDYATASFGQGFAVSPIVITRALCALANGGYLITPHIVSEINYDIGFPQKIEVQKGKQILKKQTSEKISRMLVEVVDTALLNGSVKNEKYSVAAKTGTAQMAKQDGSGYYDDRYFHSFFGYFPAYDPKFLVFLYVTNPKGVQYASETLTKPFINITKFLINYYAIPPDR